MVLSTLMLFRPSCLNGVSNVEMAAKFFSPAEEKMSQHQQYLQVLFFLDEFNRQFHLRMCY